MRSFLYFGLLLMASSAPIAAVEYLEAAGAFAGNHDLGVAIAELGRTHFKFCIET